MTTDTKAKLIVAAAGVALAATVAGISHKISQKRNALCDPLPGTSKVERIIIVKDKKK